MRRLSVVVLPALLILSPFAYAVNIGFGGGYQFGLPIGGMTGTVSATEGNDSATAKITDGVPFKAGPVGFNAGAVLGITPLISAEFGFEYHLGYENGSGTIGGTMTYDYEGESGSEPWFGEIPSDEEGEVQLSIMAVTVGARFNFPVPGVLKPYAGGGFLYAIDSKLEPTDEEDQDYLDNSYIKGTNMGAYFGGGLNWFVTPVIAINIPVKYRLFFEGKYDAYDNDGTKYDYVNPDTGNLVALDAKLKPAGILTFGLGIEVFPF